MDRTGNKNNNGFKRGLDQAPQYATDIDWTSIKALPEWTGTGEWDSLKNERAVRDKLTETRVNLLEAISNRQNEGSNFAKLADPPRFVAAAEFRDPRLVDRAADQESGRRIDQYLTALKLRLRTRLGDRRWQSLFNYEQQDIRSFQAWMEKLGVGRRSGPRVTNILRVQSRLSPRASDARPLSAEAPV